MDWHARMYDRDYALEALASAEMAAEAEAEVDLILGCTGFGPGTAALDVACGTGRHAGALARRGLDVVGIDINRTCLEIATQMHPGVRFAEADMSELGAYRGSACLVVCMYSSVGYFPDDDQNLAAFEQLAAAVRRPGFLVIQAIEYAWLVANYRPVKMEAHGDRFVLEARRFDPKTRYNEANRVVLDEASGQGRRYYVRDRVYAADEMQALLLGLGAETVQVFADATGAEFRSGESSHPIDVASFRDPAPLPSAKRGGVAGSLDGV